MVLPGESNSHYCVLGVGKNASEEEIRISYKKLAMKFHPDRNQPSLATDEKCGFIDGVREDSTRMFQKVAEAYAVLSDPDKRAIYDASSQHSRSRIARRNSTMLNTFTSNNYPNEHIPNDIEPWEIFRRVRCQQPFAKINQNANFSQPIIRKQSLRSSGKHQSKTDSYPYNECISSRSNAKRTSRKVMPPIEMEIEVKLEEFYYGCSKTAQVARKRFDEQWRLEDENFELEIEIQPGWKHGTKLTYEGFGDDDANNLTGDLIIVLVELSHETFSRKRNDLIFIKRVSLKQVFSETSFVVPTIKGSPVELQMDHDSLISPQTERRVPGLGMPSSKDPTVFGDLIVVFEVIFPEKLDPETRDKIAELLPQTDIA